MPGLAPSYAIFLSGSAKEFESAGQDSLQVGQRFTDFDSVAADLDLAHCAFETGQTFFEHANDLVNLGLKFQVAQEDDIIRHVADPYLGYPEVTCKIFYLIDKQYCHTHILQVFAKGVQMGHQVLSAQREPIAGNTIEHDDTHLLLFHLLPDYVRKLISGEMQRLYLDDRKRPTLHHGTHGNVDRFAASQQGLDRFLKSVDHRALTPAGSLLHELQPQRGF